MAEEYRRHWRDFSSPVIEIKVQIANPKFSCARKVKKPSDMLGFVDYLR